MLYVCVYVCVYVAMYVNVCVCMYVYVCMPVQYILTKSNSSKQPYSLYISEQTLYGSNCNIVIHCTLYVASFYIILWLRMYIANIHMKQLSNNRAITVTLSLTCIATATS